LKKTIEGYISCLSSHKMNGFENGHTNGNTNGHTNGHTNGFENEEEM